MWRFEEASRGHWTLHSSFDHVWYNQWPKTGVRAHEVTLMSIMDTRMWCAEHKVCKLKPRSHVSRTMMHCCCCHVDIHQQQAERSVEEETSWKDLFQFDINLGENNNLNERKANYYVLIYFLFLPQSSHSPQFSK